MNSNADKELREHTLSLIARKMLTITGVRQILNFDNLSVSFITSDGEMDIDGEELNIDSLDLERGIATVSGTISGINYINDQPAKKRKFWGRL